MQGLYLYRSPRLLCVVLQRESVIILKFDLLKFILSQCLAFLVFWDTEGKERFIFVQNAEVAACASCWFQTLEGIVGIWKQSLVDL